MASVIAFGGKYRLRFRAACLTGRVPYIGRPSCGAAVYGVCQLNRMPMPGIHGVITLPGSSVGLIVPVTEPDGELRSAAQWKKNPPS